MKTGSGGSMQRGVPVPGSARKIASKAAAGTRQASSRKRDVAALLVSVTRSGVEVMVEVMSEYSCFVKPLKWIFWGQTGATAPGRSATLH